VLSVHRNNDKDRKRPSLRTPGNIAYAALLCTTTVGTLSANVINAPLHRIQQEFHASDAEVVLTVSAFTVAMVVFVPLTGWLCDRYGAVRIVVLGLGIMVAAQLLAAFSVNLEMLILLRLAQGIACSAFPPGIQRSLVGLWPAKGQRAMVAWASAIGAGQAIGPPIGGVISELYGWRSVFFFQSFVCLVLMVTIILVVPKEAGKRVPMHPMGMFVLMLAVTASVIAVTLIGQRASLLAEMITTVVAAISIGVYAYLATKFPRRLFEPRSLLEKRYIRGTLTAGTAMLILGVCLVSLPLYLGDILGLSPGPVGVVVSAMAAAMLLSGRLTAWFSDKIGSRRVVELGLSVLIVAPLVLGWWTSEQSSLQAQLTVLVLLLLLIGTGINASQSVAAFAISRSTAAQNSMAFGIHNTARFMGMAVGYAWAALVYPLDNSLLLYGGASAAALIALLATVIGGPAPRIETTRS